MFVVKDAETNTVIAEFEDKYVAEIEKKLLEEQNEDKDYIIEQDLMQGLMYA